MDLSALRPELAKGRGRFNRVIISRQYRAGAQAVCIIWVSGLKAVISLRARCLPERRDKGVHRDPFEVEENDSRLAILAKHRRTTIEGSRIACAAFQTSTRRIAATPAGADRRASVAVGMPGRGHRFRAYHRPSMLVPWTQLAAA